MPPMQYVDALILGLVQGIAEFLPISSSGHLVIVDALLATRSGGDAVNGGFELNVALHVGTLLSILVVYRHDLMTILKRRRLCAAIAVGTVPLVAIGLYHSRLESLFNDVGVAGAGLLVTAVLLVAGQRCERDSRRLDELPMPAALLVGLFQAVAVVPGISRAGSTIAGGLFSGLRRESATAFSFFLAIPAIGGASVLMVEKLVTGHGEGSEPGVLVFGALVAFVVGVVSLKTLLRIVSQRRLHWFSWYCAVVGTAALVWRFA